MSFIKPMFLLFIYFLISFTLLYSTYKHYNIDLFAWDTPHYLAVSQSITNNSVSSPWNLRILTPFIVQNITSKFVPFYNPDITSDPYISIETKNNIFFFIVTNYLFLLLTALALFYYLRKKLNLTMHTAS